MNRLTGKFWMLKYQVVRRQYIIVKLELMKRVLAIAVHPDDETLGCGGTIAET